MAVNRPQAALTLAIFAKINRDEARRSAHAGDLEAAEKLIVSAEGQEKLAREYLTEVSVKFMRAEDANEQ